MGTHSVSFLRNESRLRRRVARGKFFSASDSYALPTDSAFGLAGRAMALKSAFCKILGRAYAPKFARWATDGNEPSPSKRGRNINPGLAFGFGHRGFLAAGSLCGN